MKNYGGCKQALYGGLGIAPNNKEMKALLDRLPGHKKVEINEEQEKNMKEHCKGVEEKAKTIAKDKQSIDPESLNDDMLKALSSNEKVKGLLKNPDYLTALTKFM